MAGKFADDEKCRDFVANLKKLREAFGWSQERLAAESHCTLVAMIESFSRAPLVEHGRAFDAAFGLADVFEAKARAICGEPFPAAFGSFTEVERKATDLSIFEHSLVPGLFQTGSYARAILLRHPHVTEAMVQERVDGRLRRQEILARDDPAPPRVWALVDEVALRRRVGDEETMHGQLMRLLAVSDLQNVTVQVIPGMEGHVGLLGAFTLAERNGQASIVNVEDIADGRVCEDPAIVASVRLTFRAMQTEALHVRASRDLIARMAEELWNGKAPTGARALTAAPMAGSA